MSVGTLHGAGLGAARAARVGRGALQGGRCCGHGWTRHCLVGAGGRGGKVERSAARVRMLSCARAHCIPRSCLQEVRPGFHEPGHRSPRGSAQAAAPIARCRGLCNAPFGRANCCRGQRPAHKTPARLPGIHICPCDCEGTHIPLLWRPEGSEGRADHNAAAPGRAQRAATTIWPFMLTIRWRGHAEVAASGPW